MSKGKSGFTVVELLIVIEIIFIIVVLAYPQLRRSFMSANEASAVGSIRSIVVGQASFKTAGFIDIDGNGEGDYGTLSQLGKPDASGTTPPFVDTYLAAGQKSGYTFTVTVTTGAGDTPPSYICTALPSKPGKSGYKMYYVDDTNVIRVTSDGTFPGPGAPPLQ